jgi:glycine dehydrogenase subunit 1
VPKSAPVGPIRACPITRASWTSSAPCPGWRQERAAGSVAVLLRRRRLSPSCAGAVDHLIQRSRVPDQLHALPAGIAQGTLQYLFEFQTQVALLTGMEVANASMYDGSTACAEAVMMAHRVTRRGKAVLSGGLHPHYAEVTRDLARWPSPARRSRARRRRRAEG